MTIALVITALYVALAYLVFVKFKWIKFSIAWGVICALTGIHVVLVFIIGMHFMTPYSTDARVIQHTIQLVPRLPEPTLVTEVLVKPNTAVKKGQPMFQFDRTPYEHKVREQRAALAAARQSVLGLQNDVTIAQAVVARAKAQRSALDAQRGILQSNLNLAQVNLVKTQTRATMPSFSTSDTRGSRRLMRSHRRLREVGLRPAREGEHRPRGRDHCRQGPHAAHAVGG